MSTYYIPRNMTPSVSNTAARPRPYSQDAYLNKSARFEIAEAGFPQVKGPVKPWIPGVSTPEGLILATGASALVVQTLAQGGESFLHAVEGIVSALLLGVIGGIPTGAIWLSSHVLYHHGG